MTNTAAPAAAEESQVVRMQDVEAALSRWVKSIQGSGETPALCARMSNLVIYCDRAALAQAVAAEVPAIVAVHPARVVLVIGEAESAGEELSADSQVGRVDQKSRSAGGTGGHIEVVGAAGEVE